MKDGIYTNEHKKLIERIIKARREAGLSQTEAAKRLGKSQSYISKIEVGQRKIDVIELKRLAKLYHKNFNFFLR